MWPLELPNSCKIGCYSPRGSSNGVSLTAYSFPWLYNPEADLAYLKGQDTVTYIAALYYKSYSVKLNILILSDQHLAVIFAHFMFSYMLLILYNVRYTKD